MDLLLSEKQRDFSNSIDDISISDDEHTEQAPLDLRLLITTFIKTSFVNNKHPVLKFWEINKKQFPELYILANILNAIPATQVRVERDFSSLSNLFGKLRCNLSDKHILLVKLNPECFEEMRSQPDTSQKCDDLKNSYECDNSVIIITSIIKVHQMCYYLYNQYY